MTPAGQGALLEAAGRDSSDQTRHDAGHTRRDFLKGSGALIVCFAAGRMADAAAQGPFDTRASHIDPKRLDSWLAIAADGSVTAYTGKCELGQGMLTAQSQLVAEELSVPIDRVHLIMCDTNASPDQGTTSGSQSTPTNFNHGSLALAAATARVHLLHLAAERLRLPIDHLTIADGVVSARGNSGTRVGYGELVAGRKFNIELDSSAQRKPASEWTVLGKPIPRLDMAAMATGQFEYVHNVHVPGMLHGAVVRPPSVAATLTNVDESSVRGMNGFVKVVVRKNFVGVVAQKPWQAMQIAARLKTTWKEGDALPAQADYYNHLRSQPSRDAFVVNSRDVDDTLASATILKATYLYPFQMHGSMGTSCAVADVGNGKATVWSPTQSAYPTRSGVAKLLGISPDAVHVIFTRGAGCYGLNGADTVSYDAALLSQAVARPVRVQLSRKDEMAWENYGFPYVIDERAGVGADGTIVAWDVESWFASFGGRPGYEQPGNVVTGMLAGFEPAPFRPTAAAEPSGEFRNGSNAAPSYVAGRVGQRAGGAGTIASERVHTHTVLSPFFTGPLRSPSRLQNTFAHESFIDEIAAHVHVDPVEYRLRHVRDQRLKDVITAAAKAARWDSRPSPGRTSARGGIASGRGMSAVAYEGTNGYVAMMLFADVERETGRIVVRRIVVAQDCGPVSNPDGLRNQIEGGALQGLSRALGEEVTWDDHLVSSIDWRTYHSLPLGFDVPVVESVLIDRHDVPATGAGETAITVVAAALGNAVFDATGARIRQAPFTAERVTSALANRA